MPKVEIKDVDCANVFANIHSLCFDKGWNESTMRQLLLMPGALGFIAYEGNIPAGFIVYAYSTDQADIVSFGVAPSFRGKKISDTLVQTSFKELQKKGIKEVFLEVSVENRYALSFYERIGFENVGKRLNYYTKGNEKTDAFIMKVIL